ncbi:MAG: DEAD/DEAH box helicase [Opitutaceae bacterium]|nr:DEAD/DEAH box helicase [Opitutaceae bacterium]
MIGELALDFPDGDLIEFADAPPAAFALRDYQRDCIGAIESAWTEFNRVLAVLGTGCGKTIIFSQVASAEVGRGGRVLILAHTDELLEQAMAKLHFSTGLRAEKEKADSLASPGAPVVVASVQTVSRDNRLARFAPGHFSLVIVDEAHRSLAASYQKILRWHHFGTEALADGWEAPEPGAEYKSFSRVLGVTATADRGDKRSLGEFYQKCVFDYGLLQACRDGYLVRPVVKNIPLQIDLKGVRTSRTANGGDFDLKAVEERLSPVITEAARSFCIAARWRKTVVFMPTINTARMGARASRELGMDATFVSGECPDRRKKLAAFDRAGPGTIIYNAMLLTEGWDCPDVSCVCVMRPTKIRALYTQCVGRGTRTLPGVIDGLATPEARCAAIAASAKRNLLILDFLWLSDRLDLVKPIDLVATRPDIRKKMEEQPACDEFDLLDSEEQAGRDMLASLEAAARKHSKKAARMIDPLAWALSIGDTALATWEPEGKWDELPATKGQLEMLERHGIDPASVPMRGMASRIIDRIIQRHKLGLATSKQVRMLRRIGVPDDKAALTTFAEASALITQFISRQSSKRAPHAHAA